MAWNDSPDVMDEDVFAPSLKTRANINVFSPNVQSGEPDEAGHYEPARSRSNFHYTVGDNEVYKPTLVRSGEAAPSMRSSEATPVQPAMQDPYTARLTSIGNQLQSAYAAPHAGAFRQILGAMFSRKNPQLGGLISGEAQRQRQIEPLQQEYGLLSDIISKNRAQQTADVTNQLHGAEMDYYRTHADVLRHPAIKPTAEENAIEDLEKQTNPDTQKPYTPSESYLKIKQGVQDTKAPKSASEEDKAISDLLASHKLPDTPANRDKARSTLKTRDRKPVDEELTDMSKQLKKAQLEKVMEATPDEQRRADLAGNLEENLKNLEDIARRRPELFGPVSGRMTGAKQWIGSSDPDVAALKVIEEQTGLAMVGAHAMRNAQHAEKAAQSITGANHTPASALLAPNGPIAKARESLATFKADAGRRRAAIIGSSSNEIHYKIVNGELVPQ